MPWWARPSSSHTENSNACVQLPPLPEGWPQRQLKRGHRLSRVPSPAPRSPEPWAHPSQEPCPGVAPSEAGPEMRLWGQDTYGGGGRVGRGRRESQTGWDLRPRPEEGPWLHPDSTADTEVSDASKSVPTQDQGWAISPGIPGSHWQEL